MKRKFVWIGVPWLLGLFLSTSFGNPLESSLTWCLLPAAWMLLGAVYLLRHIRIDRLLCAGLSLTAAFGTVFLYTAFVYQPVMQYDGTAAVFSGTVVRVTTYDGDWTSYQVKGEFADGTRAKIQIYTTDVGAVYGDKLDIAGIFSAPEDSYLWNTASYNRAKGIFLEVETDAYVSCTHTDSGKFMRLLQNYRNRISRRIVALSGSDTGGMICAMLLGDKSSLSEETSDIFAQNGISHVLSVSGLHLVLLLSVWQGVCKRLRLPRIPAFFGTTFCTLCYALLVETPVTILRAGLMFLLVQSAPLFYRKANTLHSLCFAGVILTIANPYLIHDVSFLLSMSGTFGIGVAAPWMTKKIHQKGLHNILLKKLVQMTCVSVCIFPVTILYFQEISVVAPIANLLLVPIASGMLMLALFVFLTGGVGFVAKPVCLLLQLLYDWMMLLANGLHRLVSATFSTGWSLFPALMGILLALVLVVFWMKRSQKAVALTTAVSFAILLVGQTVYRVGEQSCFLISVLGRTDEAVVVICYQGRTDVIDLTGDRKNPDYVEQFLTENGIHSIDSLCLLSNVSQMRVLYEETLTQTADAAIAVCTACQIPEGTTVCGAALQKADAILLKDMDDTIQIQDGMIFVTDGMRSFYIGTEVESLPDGNWDGAVCTTWSGDADMVTERVYVKAETLQIRIKSNESWTVETLS